MAETGFFSIMQTDQKKRRKETSYEMSMRLGTRSVLIPSARFVPAAISIITDSPTYSGIFTSYSTDALICFPLAVEFGTCSSVPLDRTELRHFGPRRRRQVPDRRAQRKLHSLAKLTVGAQDTQHNHVRPCCTVAVGGRTTWSWRPTFALCPPALVGRPSTALGAMRESCSSLFG